MALDEEKQKTKEKYNKLVKKYFTIKKVLIGVILLVVFLLFSDAFKGILLLAIFLPLAKYSVKITNFVPHVTLEQYSSSTLFMSYIYGPVAGGLSGLVLGLYGYLSNSNTKFLSMTNVFLCALTGTIMGFVASKNIFGTLSFSIFFIIGVILFNLIAYVVFLFVDSDQFQNATYRIFHLFFNCLISVVFFNLLYIVFNLI